jgi:hypothetical protein
MNEKETIDALATELCRRVGAPYPSPKPIKPTDYTWSQEQEDDYRAWAVNLLKSKGPLKRMGKKYINAVMDTFLGNYGWMIAPKTGANEPKGGTD